MEEDTAPLPTAKFLTFALITNYDEENSVFDLKAIKSKLRYLRHQNEFLTQIHKVKWLKQARAQLPKIFLLLVGFHLPNKHRQNLN